MDQVELLKNQLEKDLLESGTMANSQEFANAHIAVQTNLENLSDVMVFDRRGGQARKYRPGKVKTNTVVGGTWENKLEISVSVYKAQDFIENYRAKEGFSILGTNGEYDPKGVEPAEFAMRQMAKALANQVYMNVFHGVASYDDNELTMFDGFLAVLAKHTAASRIAQNKRNLFDIDLSLDIATATGDDLRQLYKKFVFFYNRISPLLRIGGFDVLLTPELFSNLGFAYAATFQSVNPDIVNSPSFKFTQMPMANFIPTDMLGTGDKIIATKPFNLEYATDLSSGDFSAAGIEIWKDNSDRKMLNYQWNMGAGTRIRQVSPDMFCTTTGTLQPHENFDAGYTLTEEELAEEEAVNAHLKETPAPTPGGNEEP